MNLELRYRKVDLVALPRLRTTRILKDKLDAAEELNKRLQDENAEL